MVPSPLEMDPRSEEMMKLEWEKLGCWQDFDSCNFYLAGCLACSVTDVLPTLNQGEWHGKEKVLFSFFIFFFFILGDQEVSFNLHWTYLCLYLRFISFSFKTNLMFSQLSGLVEVLLSRNVWATTLWEMKGLSHDPSPLDFYEQKAGSFSWFKWEISNFFSAYKKGPLEAVLQTDTGLLEK